MKLGPILCVALFVTSCQSSSNDVPASGGSAVATPTGGSTPSGDKPKRDLGKLDGCALLTAAEIEAALGVPKPGNRDKAGCIWHSEAQKPDFEVELDIDQITSTRLEMFEDSLKNAEYFEPVAGVGEAAVRSKQFTALTIKYDGLFIELQVRTAWMPQEKADAALVPLGKAIVGRL